MHTLKGCQCLLIMDGQNRYSHEQSTNEEALEPDHLGIEEPECSHHHGTVKANAIRISHLRYQWWWAR
jgi:hypothetical protein